MHVYRSSLGFLCNDEFVNEFLSAILADLCRLMCGLKTEETVYFRNDVTFYLPVFFRHLNVIDPVILNKKSVGLRRSHSSLDSFSEYFPLAKSQCKIVNSDLFFFINQSVPF